MPTFFLDNSEDRHTDSITIKGRPFAGAPAATSRRVWRSSSGTPRDQAFFEGRSTPSPGGGGEWMVMRDPPSLGGGEWMVIRDPPLPGGRRVCYYKFFIFSFFAPIFASSGTPRGSRGSTPGGSRGSTPWGSLIYPWVGVGWSAGPLPLTPSPPGGGPFKSSLHGTTLLLKVGSPRGGGGDSTIFIRPSWEMLFSL